MKRKHKSEIVEIAASEPRAIQPVMSALPSLPCSDPVPMDTTEMHLAVARVFPDEVSRALLAEHQAPRGHSPLQLFFALLCLGGMSYLLWYIFPHANPASAPLKTTEIETVAVKKKSPYFDLAVEAQALFNAGNYGECARALRPHIPDLLKQRVDESNDRLLLLFFDAVRIGPIDKETHRFAVNLVRRQTKDFPDHVEWQVLLLALSEENFLDYERLYRDIWRGNYSNVFIRNRSVTSIYNLLHRIRKLIKSCDQTILVNPQRKEQLTKARINLRFMQASLLTSQWMLIGGKGKTNFPDDFGAPGVYEREEALRITRHPDPGCKSIPIDFLRLRLFLARRVLEQSGGLFNSFHWNGQKHNSQDDLRREADELQRQINAAEKR